SDNPTCNLLTLHTKNLQIRIIGWWHIEIRLDFCSRRCGYRISFPAGFFFVDPKILAWFSRSATPAVSPFGGVIAWVRIQCFFFEIQKLCKACLPEQPTSSQIRFSLWKILM